jgi:hypothetical protein
MKRKIKSLDKTKKFNIETKSLDNICKELLKFDNRSRSRIINAAYELIGWHADKGVNQ